MDQTYTVSDAIELIGTGKVQYYVITASGFGLMALLLDTMGLSMTIPASTCELELDTFRKGLLNSMPFLGIALTSHLWGFLADSIGRNKSIRYSLIGSIILSGISAMVPNFWIIIVLRLLSGMSLSGASSTLYAYMGEMLSNKARTKMMVIFGSFIGIAVIIMCGVGWAINATQPQITFSEQYAWTPWRIQWLVLLLPAIMGVFIYSSLPESPHFLMLIGDEKGAYDAIKTIFHGNNGINSEFPIKKLVDRKNVENGGGEKKVAHNKNLWEMCKSMARETMVLLRPPYLGPILCCCFVQYSIYTVASGIGMWYPEITNRLNFDEGNATAGEGFCDIFTAKKSESLQLQSADFAKMENCHVVVNDKMFIDNMILGAGYFVANTVIYFLQMKIQLRHIVVLFLAVSSVSGFLLPTFTSEVAVLVCFTLFLMSSGSCVTTINIITVSAFPTFLRGMTLSMTLVLGRIAIVVGVNGLGFLLESFCQPTIYVVAGIVAGASLITMFLMPKKAIGE